MKERRESDAFVFMVGDDFNQPPEERKQKPVAFSLKQEVERSNQFRVDALRGGRAAMNTTTPQTSCIPRLAASIKGIHTRTRVHPALTKPCRRYGAFDSFR